MLYDEYLIFKNLFTLLLSHAWNKEKLQTFMNERGSLKEEFQDMSEPDLLISVMDRHEDWCVIVCLVGGGQEINRGEAGISTWIESMEKFLSFV